MKSQANRNYKSDDEIMTPEYLAEALVNHFKPSGKILEPCKGTGNFLKFLPKGTLWCEISEGKNFFDFNEKVDWIITNPPWSQIRKFLQHSLEISKNVCFLFTINHLWTKARIKDIKKAGFGIREIVLFDTPDNFPPLGFQVGMIHLQYKYSGDIIFSDLFEKCSFCKNDIEPWLDGNTDADGNNYCDNCISKFEYFAEMEGLE